MQVTCFTLVVHVLYACYTRVIHLLYTCCTRFRERESQLETTAERRRRRERFRAVREVEEELEF